MKSVQVYDAHGAKSGTLDLGISLTKRDESPAAFAQAIHTLRQNWRQGTVGCKDRSEVSFSGKKPWRQKGTGRARAGSARSPLWRSGGVTFGPQSRVRKLKVGKKHTQLVFNNLLFNAFERNSIYALDVTVTERPSTKVMAQLLKQSGLSTKPLTVFLQQNDDALILSFRNLPNVRLVAFDAPNAFDLSQRTWVFLKKDVEAFKDMVQRWN